MGEYTRTAGDKAFRKVHLHVPGVPDFENFARSAERIPFGEDEVLEIVKENGETVVYSGVEKPGVLYYTFPEPGVLKINSAIPQLCARLWLRRNGTQMLYKLPNNPPIGKDQKVYLKISGTVGDLVLVGDRYFNAVYTLRQN